MPMLEKGLGSAASDPLPLLPKREICSILNFMISTEEQCQAYSGSRLPFNRFAKAVSGVSVATTTQPIDRYGKRVYVPTRVDFPEVQLSMYDVVDGQMFSFAMGIYNQFFKNGQMRTDTANIENSLRDLNAQGRKFSHKGKPFHQTFEKVTIFHFFW